MLVIPEAKCLQECQIIHEFTAPSALLNEHNQYLNEDVWNQPYENQISTLQCFFQGYALNSLTFLI